MCGCVAAMMALRAARSQSASELRLEGGSAQIHQDGRVARTAGLLGLTWRASDERFASIASGAFTYAGDSMTAAQAIAALAWRPFARSPWQTEVGVIGSAFGVYQLGRGGNLSSYLRQRVALSDGGLWVGGAAGHTSRDGISSHSTAVDVGASIRFGDFETNFSWARLRSDDWKLLEASGIFLERDAAAHDLDDKAVTLHYERARVKVDLSRTWRDGQRGTIANQAATFGSVEYCLTSRFSVALAVGRQLADPVRGVPDVQVVSAALRIMLLPWRAEVDDGVSRRAVASVIPNEEGALLTVRVVAAETQRVEVAGSFSGWEPLPLHRTSDGWEASVELERGRHRVAVRIDGGRWRAPGHLGKVMDEFGGASGIIVVP